MNIIVFGAHPDDCEYHAGGTTVKWVKAGAKVKFVSVTNGDAGHFARSREELARIRKAEAAASGEALGVVSEVLDFHDGALLPTLEVREAIIRRIRDWRADVVVTHRPGDYHPDHRATGLAVQDTAYLVIVPNVCPDTPAPRKNPVYLHTADDFRSPEPFRPDIIVPIDDVFTEKVSALHQMPSQFYEWLPWVDGELDRVPATDDERRAWLERRLVRPNHFPAETARLYGRAAAETIGMTEAFQICGYGRRPSEEDIREMFPFLPEFVEKQDIFHM